MVNLKNGRQVREERERLLKLNHKMKHRITVAKYGKEYMDSGDYSNAIVKYVEYLQTMAEYKQTKDYFSLSPSHFDPKKEITEMLLISHIFFEMARVYDAIPKFTDEAKKCLDRFTSFSANQPYQVVNSEMIRKYLKKEAFKNKEMFKTAHQQIFVQSKKCYIVTFCYGTEHPVTQHYRLFKDWLLNYEFGQFLVRFYYRHSSLAVEKWQHRQAMKIIGRYLIRPILSVFSKTLLRRIIK